MCLVYIYLAEYILRTRKPRSSAKLFILWPHKQVDTTTIGRWIKSFPSSAGIDTSVYSVQSVGGVSFTNAYIKGVPIAEILRTANLTN